MQASSVSDSIKFVVKAHSCPPGLSGTHTWRLLANWMPWMKIACFVFKRFIVDAEKVLIHSAACKGVGIFERFARDHEAILLGDGAHVCIQNHAVDFVGQD